MSENSKSNKPRIAVCPDRYQTAFPNAKAKLDALKVLTLEDAFSTKFKCDAHALLYIQNESETQPRILKAYAKSFDYPLHVETFFADCDNFGHAPWTEETLTTHIEEVAKKIDGLGIYYTKNGYRLIQQVQAVSVFLAEKHITKWLKGLEQQGHDVDWGCRDWTRMFRLPHVIRDGKQYDSPYVDISRISTLTLDFLDLGVDEEPDPETREHPVYELVPEWPAELPKDYDEKAKVIATELLRIQDPWHPIFLAIAGALNSRGVPVEHLPLFCRQVAYHAHDSRPEDRYHCGKTTATKRFNNQPTRGLTYLYSKYPALAEAIDVAFGIIKKEEAQDISSIDIAFEDIKEKFRTAPKGVTIIKAVTGLGKTRGAIEVAVERDRDEFKTAISVDKNKLAKQVTGDIRAMGIDSYRVYGALSLKDNNGNPVCIHHDIAQALADGGQSISYELCQGRGEEKCEMYEDCEARKGFEGQESSHIIVSNHNKLKQMIDHVGKKGLMIIDEPKNFVVTHKITKKDRELLSKRMDNFEYRYMQYAKQYLNRVIEWQDESLSFKDLAADVDLSPIELIESRHRTGVPPIKKEYLHLLRKQAEISEEIGKCSKIIYLLYRAKMEKSVVILNGNDIEITLYDEDMRAALTKEGAVVITDANANLYKDQIEAITGNKPTYHEYNIADNKVERTLIKVKGANRSNWINRDKILYKNGVLEAFKWILEWHKPGQKLGIITFYPIEKAFLEKDPSIPTDLLNLNPMVAHYYNVRGMNDMMDLDELVTLGDPWKNRGAVQKELEFHGINANQERLEYQICQAELEQSHGRLRPTRRIKPGRSLHIGNVLPSGYGWDKAQVRNKPRLGSSLIKPEQIKNAMKEYNLNQSEMAKFLGVDQSGLSKVLSGKLNLSYSAAEKLRKLSSG